MSKDYLKNTKLEIFQRDDMFKMNTDTHLLGEFMHILHKDTVLDIGCNNGALLLYASQYKPKKLVGVDVFQEAIEVAKSNMELHDLKADLYACGVQNLQIEPVDVIVCNPPYFPTQENGHKNNNPFLLKARHEEELTLEVLFDQFKRLLKENGRIYMVHQSLRFNEIFEQCLKHKMRMKQVRFVYDEKKDQASSVLMEITFGKTAPVKFLKPIVLQRDQ